MIELSGVNSIFHEVQAPSEGPAMTDVALICEEHDPLDGSVHGQLICSKDVFDLESAQRLVDNLQVIHPLVCMIAQHVLHSCLIGLAPD